MRPDQQSMRLQLWGGVEPTVNRVGDEYFHQFQRSGHRQRLSDLDEFARIGLRTLRFPILWEEVAPDLPEQFDWNAIDAPLQRLRDLGIRPIAGLLHHGSGPRYTSLTDSEFPQKLAAFARAVARRYPWIDAYTPVNEPLTTARFSGLYGIWYPHGHDPQTFARCLINQCRGVVLAMRAIREVNSEAALVQTDDLGRTYSRPELQHQADYENERRWITWDLLTGKVDRASRMWPDLRCAGIAESELAAFEESPCPPEILGINHYITSERFLDSNLDAHPPETHGGNGRERYADVAAVRARREGVSGAEGVLREAWRRYGIPLAVTEAHLACTREEQLRWFIEVWRGANTLREEGVDVRAVTVWSLVGAYDWNSLLTRSDGFYEPGAYDLRGGKLRRTAIATMIDALAHGRLFNHPVLQTEGWWRRSVRMLGPIESAADEADTNLPVAAVLPVRSESASITRAEPLIGRPILITGAAGRLAQGFIRAAELRGLSYRLFSHAEMDITDEAGAAAAVESCAPWAIINCAGYSRIDAAEKDERRCYLTNTRGAAILAKICARIDVPFVTFSSDQVFEGLKNGPYVESDETSALNVYGESKLLAEREVLAAHPAALVIRLGEVFAPSEDADLLRRNLRAIARGESISVANDLRLSAGYLPDVVHAALDLLIDNERGTWHLANAGTTTPEQFLITAAERAGLPLDRIEGVPSWRLNRPAVRPPNRTLASERGQLLPPLADALDRYYRESPRIENEPVELLATS